jgi:nitroimidazol reductase NimA-like FMN-containing flavoprotein (pyridoxamine 5'-phosphate oxidase superfamily)
MRRKEKEITDRRTIDNILSSSSICRVAFFDSEFPYIVPLNYGYYDNAIYFHSSTNGKKIELIKRNNKVCFEIDHLSRIIKDEKPCKWTTKYQSVIGYGTIAIITDFKQKIKGLEIIMKHYGKLHNEFDPDLVDRTIILKLMIERLTGKQS